MLFRSIQYSPSNTLFPNGQRTQTETFVITPPGSLFYPRWNEVDVNIKKNFRNHGKLLTFQLDIYNLFNVNTPRSENNNVGASLGDATTIATGRFPRLAVNYRF